MRVTLVTPRYLPHRGGIELHVAQLAAHLREVGWRVTVATLRYSRGVARNELIDGVAVRRFDAHLPVRGHGVLSPALWRWVARGADNAQLVHAHNYHAPAALFAAAGAKVPVVFTPHFLGFGASISDAVLPRIYRPVAAGVLQDKIRAVVHVSESEEVDFAQHLEGRVLPRTLVIPNGVAVHDLMDAEPLEGAGRLLLCAGRLEEYKRNHLVIEALPHLPDDLHLAIAGDGPARSGLERTVAALGVSDRVTFLGRLPWADLVRWYRTSHVFVSLSSKECFGMAVAEALVAGAGVVASDIRAHREVMSAAGYPSAGLLIRQPDPVGVASAIRRALTERAVPGARRLPTWREVALRTERLYRGLLEDDGRLAAALDSASA